MLVSAATRTKNEAKGTVGGKLAKANRKFWLNLNVFTNETGNPFSTASASHTYTAL